MFETLVGLLCDGDLHGIDSVTRQCFTIANIEMLDAEKEKSPLDRVD